MKKKILIISLFLAFFVLSISGLSTVRADEMFFVDFYVEDSQGAPLNGVEIEVTGVYNYDEFTYTGSDGYAPRLTLFSDQRNVQYNYTATYQQITQSGDFYVPNNYNAVNIIMVEVNAPTPTPSPTPSPPPPTASPSPSPTLTQNPTTNPTSNPTSNPTANQIATPTPAHSTAKTPTPTENSQTTAPTADPSPTVPEFPSILVVTVLITAVLLGTFVLRIKQSKDKLKQ